MPRYDEVAKRWCDRVTGRTERANFNNPRMPIRDDIIYSYGSHFELARPLRDRDGRTAMFLINGDRWSGTVTTRQQGVIRGAIADTQLPSVIVPHSALRAAGIDRGSVRIIDRSNDTWEVTEHVHHELPPNAILEWVKFSDYVELGEEELQARVDKHNAEQVDDHARRVRWARDELGKDGRRFWVRDYLTKAPAPVTVQQWLAAKPTYERHWITRERRVIGHELKCWTDRRRHHEWQIRYLPDGRTLYRRETRRHWLGESLISGEIEYVVRSRCKACLGMGHQIGPPNIFQRTERNWRNTGEYTTTEVEVPPPACETCGGRGRLFRTRTRRAKFLSGFDSNEATPSYFFCELPPKSTATTVAEAYAALKPDSVRLAEQMGRAVKRQGDIFAVPLTAMTKRQLTRSGARFERRGNLLSTNHEATEVAYLPDGTTLVRGCLTHAPIGRRPDHRRVTLGRQWHVVQKNLVPIAA